jgi:sulfopyruvate decarboxylase subunit alpha
MTVRSTGAALVDEFVEHHWDYFSGVPCSLLKGAFTHLETLGTEQNPHYLPAPREEAAVAAATGAYLAGRNPVVLMQNSGLGYCLNTLTSLTLIYRIPLVLVISWRGHGPDAVEHTVIGRVVERLLDNIEVPHQVLGDVRPAVEWSTSTASSSGGPAALLVTEEI